MTWWVAGTMLVGTVGSALVNSNAASKAASGAQNAANAANQLSDAQFQQTRTDMAPWRGAGTASINQLGYLLGLPGYGPPQGQQTIGMSPEGRVPRPQQLGEIGNRTAGATIPGPGKWSPEGWAPKQDGQPEMGLQQTLAMEDYGGVSAGGGNFDYNPSTGAWDATTVGASTAPGGGGAYNTQMGDFGSLSRDFGMSDFTADPGYQFRFDEGQKALERSAASKGRFLGGGTLKALSRYGQDMGSQEYGNAFNRFNLNRSTRFNQLASIAGLGQTSAGQLGQLGAQNAAYQGGNLTGAATAAGNAGLAGAAGWGNALNTGLNTWATYQGMK